MYNNKAIRRVVRAGRRSTIGNRVTGYNLFEGSNPLLSAKNEKAVPQGMAFSFFICKGFEQGGSRLACGRLSLFEFIFYLLSFLINLIVNYFVTVYKSFFV